MVYFEEKPTVTFTANYTDWTGTVEEWRRAFFTLLMYKNSYNGFLELTINAYGDHSAYLHMVIDSKKLNAEAVHEKLIELGYKNVDTYESKARFVDSFDLDDSGEFYGTWYIE